MTDKTPTYRLALNDSSHAFYEATWLIFSEKMKTKFASKKLEAQKDDLVPYLFEIVDDEDLREVGSLGKGYAPGHAIQLLGAWGVTEAAPRLLDIFEHEDDDSLIWEATVVALEHMGPGLVEEMFALLDRMGQDRYATIAGILSQVGQEDQRSFDWLAAQLDLQKEHWDIRWYAECLLECDRSQAIPLLEERIRKRKFDVHLREILQDWIELAREGKSF